MSIIISTRQFELTESIDSKIKKSFEKSYSFVKDGNSINVHLERTTNHHRQGEVYKLEATVTSGGRQYHVQEMGEDVYKLADLVGDKLEREVVEGKDTKIGKDRSLARRVKGQIKNLKFW